MRNQNRNFITLMSTLLVLVCAVATATAQSIYTKPSAAVKQTTVATTTQQPNTAIGKVKITDAARVNTQIVTLGVKNNISGFIRWNSAYGRPAGANPCAALNFNATVAGQGQPGALFAPRVPVGVLQTLTFSQKGSTCECYYLLNDMPGGQEIQLQIGLARNAQWIPGNAPQSASADYEKAFFWTANRGSVAHTTLNRVRPDFPASAQMDFVMELMPKLVVR